MSRKFIFLTTLATAILSLALFTIALVNGWFGAEGGIGDIFCEASHPGLIKQPANTFSNFGFIVVGLLMGWQLAAGRFKENNTMTRSTFFGTFFACLVVLLGPGSMALHATTAKVGGFFDMLSMYLLASFTTAYAMQRFFSWRPVHFTLIFAIALSICIWADFQTYHIIFDYFGNTVFGFFITLTILFELLNNLYRKMQHKRAWGIAAALFLLTALTVWNLSKTGAPYCDPSSLIQGHAIWHLLDAVAVYCLFRFYVSERKAIYD